MREQWKVLGFTDGTYAVSNFGNVKRLKLGKTGAKPRLLKLNKGNRYVQVNLYYPTQPKGKGYYVHQLVATYFLGPKPSSKHEPNHKDRWKSNNRSDNLEWLTHSQNQKHHCDLGIGLPPILRGKAHPNFGSKKYVGAGNPMWGKTHSKAARSKISLAAKGNQRWLGRHHSEATKEKIRQTKLAKKK